MPSFHPEINVPRPDDGPVRSWQKIVSLLGGGAIPPANGRITEEGDSRSTEEGDMRDTE